MTWLYNRLCIAADNSSMQTIIYSILFNKFAHHTKLRGPFVVDRPSLCFFNSVLNWIAENHAFSRVVVRDMEIWRRHQAIIWNNVDSSFQNDNRHLLKCTWKCLPNVSRFRFGIKMLYYWFIQSITTDLQMVFIYSSDMIIIDWQIKRACIQLQMNI